MNLIEVQNAAFSYEKKEIFRDITLNLKKGEICCLMGPNGCGKSTLLDCILGILTLKKGEIKIDNRDINFYKPPELAKKLSYVPQLHHTSFPYTVRQVVLMGRSAYIKSLSEPSKEEKQMVDNALENVGIVHLKDTPYTQISGGEMQLVMLARALVQDSPVMIMDEPTAHLDFKNELIFLQTVVKTVREKNTSVIMATHSPNHPFYLEGKGLNVKIAAMRKGSIYCTGIPSGILTEKTIEEIYGIKTKRLEYREGTKEPLYQILPIKTIKER